jgi:uncharacterized protein
VDTKPKTRWIDRLSGRSRWRLQQAILCFPVLLSLIQIAAGHHPRLPDDLFHFASFLGLELLSWGTVFLAAFYASGITARQLRLEISQPLRAICLGILWFVVIQALSSAVFGVVLKWVNPHTLWEGDEKVFSAFNAQSIVLHPGFSIAIYGTCALIAGFTEELWRAGMLAGLEAAATQSPRKGIAAWGRVFLISILFGLSHLYQDWFGVGHAILAGFLLGLVLIYRNSYWEAAIAHALIDAYIFGIFVITMLDVHRLDSVVIYYVSHNDVPQTTHWLAVGGNANTTYKANNDWTGITVLEYAVQKPDTDMVRLLLDQGADPNLKDSKENTALMVAAKSNQLPNLKLLIAKGANLNLQNNLGYTALRTAADYNRVEVARLLLENGANPNLKDNEGLTPLTVAEQRNYPELVDLLKKVSGP